MYHNPFLNLYFQRSALNTISLILEEQFIYFDDNGGSFCSKKIHCIQYNRLQYITKNLRHF